MTCEKNVESAVIRYFEVAGPGNWFGFAQNVFLIVDTYKPTMQSFI